MLPALSEPVALPVGTAVRFARVSQSAATPVPERFLHFHGPAELVLIEQGSGCYVSEAGEFRFSAGTMLYAPAMAIHDFAFAEGARRWTLVQFDPRVADPTRTALPPQAAAARLDPGGGDRTVMLLDWLGACVDAGASPEEVATVLSALLLSLKGRFGTAPAAGSDAAPQPSRFRPLLDQWVRAPDRALTLTEAASLCALSPAYFSRQFRRAFGAGFIAYQTQMRLQQAARIIATTDEPISQVGYRLGFRSPAYLSLCYKAAFGVSPSAHRKAARARRAR